MHLLLQFLLYLLKILNHYFLSFVMVKFFTYSKIFAILIFITLRVFTWILIVPLLVVIVPLLVLI